MANPAVNTQASPRVKAFLVSSVEVMTKGDDGLPAVFAGNYDSAAQKAAISGVTDFATMDAEPDLTIETNRDLFEAEDGTYFGPFAAAFAVTDPASAAESMASAKRLMLLRNSKGLWPLRASPAEGLRRLSPTMPDEDVLAVLGEKVIVSGSSVSEKIPTVALTEAERKRRAELEELKNPTKELALDLRSESMPIRLSAIRVFQRIKDPVSPTLLRAAMTFAQPLVSAEAVKALVFQSREDLPEMLVDIVRSMPDDASRLQAAFALTKPGDNAHNAVLATLLTAKTTQGRLGAVRVFAKINTPESRMLATTFLRDVSPSVRHAVVSLIAPAEDIPAKAILYAGINDISEAVRGTALGRVASGPDRKRADEAKAALATETPGARAFALPYLSADEIIKAQTDPSPWVRRRAWSLAVEPVDADERDRDVLREIAVFPGKLPEALEKRISESNDPVIRELRHKGSQFGKPIGSKFRLKS